MAAAHFRVCIKNSFISADKLNEDATSCRPLRRCFSDSRLERMQQLSGVQANNDQVMVIETNKQLLTKHGVKKSNLAMFEASSRSSTAWADEVDDDQDFAKTPSTLSQSTCAESTHSSEASLPAGSTTLMLRHLPRYAYSTQSLQEEVERAGFLHVLDFIYVPPDLKKHRNRGFAFLNFVHETHAARFLKAYDGKSLSGRSKPLSVCAADSQGFAALWERFHKRGSDELISGYEPRFVGRAPVTRPAMSKPDTVPGSRRKFVQPDAARAGQA